MGHEEIKIVHLGKKKWVSDDGNHKTRALIGRSIDGWHAGLEVSVRGGAPEINWSEALNSRKVAEGLSKDFSDWYRMGFEPDYRASAPMRSRDWDSRDWDR